MSTMNTTILYEEWEGHCHAKQAAGDNNHKPCSEGGTATFDRNLASTYMRCCVQGCVWELKLDDALASREQDADDERYGRAVEARRDDFDNEREEPEEAR